MNDEKIMPNPQFPYEETLKYIKLAQSGDREAMNELVERNMALVRSIVKKYLNRGTEYDDLYQIGSMGLVKAIKNFDSSYGVRFSTYAVPMIAGEIKRFLRDDGMIKVSRTLKELSLAISRLNNESKLKNGRELTVSELAERLDTSEEKIIDALNSTRVPLSLTAEYDSEGNPQLDVPTDDIQDEISERLSLEQAVKSLCDTDRKIIQLRYYRSKTQTQTAKILSMTQVQISRREKKILTAIRDKMSV